MTSKEMCALHILGSCTFLPITASGILAVLWFYNGSLFSALWVAFPPVAYLAVCLLVGIVWSVTRTLCTDLLCSRQTSNTTDWRGIYNIPCVFVPLFVPALIVFACLADSRHHKYPWFFILSPFWMLLVLFASGVVSRFVLCPIIIRVSQAMSRT